MTDDDKRTDDNHPAWHDKPTCPGLWLVYDSQRLLWPWRVIDGEMRLIPAVVLGVYGPIPEPPA